MVEFQKERENTVKNLCESLCANRFRSAFTGRDRRYLFRTISFPSHISHRLDDDVTLLAIYAREQSLSINDINHRRTTLDGHV